ncbi:hypothetical protein B0H14DRAFT_2579531 [Mycena olivaceomarginata]|nr:hypothetical protein B0H14DRAFT_2579531 [Mycena olivaceomarginata]
MVIKDIDDIPDTSIIISFFDRAEELERDRAEELERDLETELGAATEIVKTRQAEAQVAQFLLEEAAAALKSREQEAKLTALRETAARDPRRIPFPPERYP